MNGRAIHHSLTGVAMLVALAFWTALLMRVC